MSTADENGNRATVAGVDAKVDGLKDFIALGFENIARRLDDLAGLEPRIRQLEQDAVRRVGPIVDEMRAVEKRVEDLSTTVDELAAKSVTSEQVRVALQFERDQQSTRAGDSFSKKEKLLGLCFAASLTGLNIFQALHNL